MRELYSMTCCGYVVNLLHMQHVVHKINAKMQNDNESKHWSLQTASKNNTNYVLVLHLRTVAKCCNFWQNDLRNNGNSGCNYTFSTSPGETFNTRYILTMNTKVKQNHHIILNCASSESVDQSTLHELNTISPWARPKTGTTRVAISTIHFCKADILGFLKSPVGHVNVVA